MTLKLRVTPARRQILALRASARPISVKDFTGWPTATVNDSRSGRNRTAVRTNPESAHHDGQTLVEAAELAAWPTPRTPTGGAESTERKQELGRTESGGGDLQAVAQTAGWNSPIASEARQGFQDRSRGMKGSQESLTTQAIKHLPERERETNRMAGAPRAHGTGRTLRA